VRRCGRERPSRLRRQGTRIVSAIMPWLRRMAGWPTRARSTRAKVAELADALDLGSSGETRESSSLSFRTSSPEPPQISRRRVAFGSFELGLKLMQVSLSDTGGLSRRMEVAVPATEVANEVQ